MSFLYTPLIRIAFFILLIGCFITAFILIARAKNAPGKKWLLLFLAAEFTARFSHFFISFVFSFLSPFSFPSPRYEIRSYSISILSLLAYSFLIVYAAILFKNRPTHLNAFPVELINPKNR